jgi:hypothetical protein
MTDDFLRSFSKSVFPFSQSTICTKRLLDIFKSPFMSLTYIAYTLSPQNTGFPPTNLHIIGIVKKVLVCRVTLE